ncbi:bifunctional glycosyltransferase/CDP-glycerol:glycerophosphate glycerophosphotransferase [Nocardiopsis valliformis]|uniref:bifunctional glycosyltransferase/CDP-glycerol:glycerophosphate glycerophosphotransferase n=1 Tax=Nocardiopsis valliformis TaxID=239974 RepID=UPI0003477C47|nr:bifunctional glycosyltransferase/CDP-glycerol:glycerophosphate glycerophosphotransferase [Nocardiopsis valliformis]
MVALTVIVPVYNVERYLDACLRSLQVQSWTDLEVVMVDDGSKDSSADIAARYVEQDPRFRLVQQENGGLGAARNTGTRHARGEFLTFVDSDDIIPPYAFGYHMNSLRQSGSDFSSGNVHLLTELSISQSPMHRDIFRESRSKTHVTRDKSLLVDRLATNKVWRKDFWDKHGLSFPVGVLYEDEAVAIPLHFLAESVDILSQPVYLWRQRPSDDKSITQDRFRPNAMEDRFTAVTSVSDFVTENMRAQDKRDWDAVALGQDLRAFVQVLDKADDEFVERFLKLASNYLETVDGRVFRELSAIERLKWHFIRQGQGKLLQQAVAFSKSPQFRQSRTVRHGVRFYGDYLFKDDPEHKVPRSVYRLDRELQLRQKVEDLTWSEGRLVIRGRVCLKFLRPNKRLQQHVRAVAVNTRTGRRVRLPISSHLANEFRLPARTTTSRQDWGGYEITVDPKALGWTSAGQDSDWQIELAVFNRGYRRTARLAAPGLSKVRRVGPAEVEPNVWVRPRWIDGHTFQLSVDHDPVRLTRHGFDGGTLSITGELPAAMEGVEARLRLLRSPGDVEISLPLSVRGRTFEAEVDLSVITEGYVDRALIPGAIEAESWRAQIVAGDKTKEITNSGVLPTDYHRFDGLAVLLSTEYNRELSLRVERQPSVITEVAWNNRELVLSGEHYGETEGTTFLLSAKGRVEEYLFPVEFQGSGFQVRFSPADLPTFGNLLPLSPGSYKFCMRNEEEQGRFKDVSLRLDATLLSQIPVDMPGDDFDISVEANPQGHPWLRVGWFLRPQEKGAYAQQLLREKTYPSLRGKPVTPGVLFDSYSGKQYSDSPRGMSEELRERGVDAPLSWLVRDLQVPLPEGLNTVRVSSREYYEALARSEFIVSNAHLPVWFDKRPGQTIVQTWHGSMLKRIGFDISDVQFGNRDYHERLKRETNQWDYLVSPSPWATPILRSAFGFEGEILETGYPRNDIFHRPEREALTERVRGRLGLPEGKKVVLYAPTWRDNKFYGPGKYKLDLNLDLQRLYEELGDDHVLLVRRHPNIVDRVPTVGKDFVYDVSSYPEIQELFLVTDILVTDYSSLMFDFANTGRPMLFFTYDLEEYRDNLRGFYFDFETTAPGPLLRTSDEVIESIRGIDGVRAEHAERYDAFVKQFCPLDDGKAAARVVEKVFGKLL